MDSSGSPAPLYPEVKDYFRKPNEITRGLSSTSPSIFEEYFQLVYPALKGKKVLDVGAGKGRVSIRLAVNGSEVTAVDLSAEGLAELERNAEMQGVRVRALQGDAESLQFPDKSVDAVFCIETLVHVPNISKALSEFKRVLTDDGILLVSVTLPLNLSAWLKLSGKEFIVAPFYSSRFYQNYVRKLLARPPRTGREIREKEIVRALESSGFTPLYNFTVLSRFLLMIAKKTAALTRRSAAISPSSTRLDCPFEEIYPDTEVHCMASNCGKLLSSSGQHYHLQSTGECRCPDHLNERRWL